MYLFICCSVAFAFGAAYQRFKLKMVHGRRAATAFENYIKMSIQIGVYTTIAIAILVWIVVANS